MNGRVQYLTALAAGVAAIFSAASVSSAQGATLYNQDLAAPGVYFGTGNPNGAFAVNTEGGVEVALRSKISGIHPQITPTGDTYFIPLGDKFNFDYSVNPNVGGSEVSLADVTASLKLTNLANGHVYSFDPSSALLGNATNSGAPGGYQNSEKISFGFLNMAYDPNLNDTFHLVLTLNNVPDVGTISVSNIVQVGNGAAVPEPATWAMMLAGFGGLGAALRSRRKATASLAG